MEGLHSPKSAPGLFWKARAVVTTMSLKSDWFVIAGQLGIHAYN